MLEEKTLSRRTVYRGRILRLRVDEALLPNGRTAEREVVEHPGGVCVCALTDEGNVLLVDQFRYPYGEVLTEVPAGKLEPGEDPLVCGRRELKEETGAVAREFTSLGVMYPSPGYMEEVIYLYMATGVTMGEMSPDEDEFLQVRSLPLQEAVEMVMDGRIKDAKTAVILLKVKLLLESEALL